MLEFITEFGKSGAPCASAIVACVPKKVHMEGLDDAKFEIHPHEIIDAITAGLCEPIEAEPEV